MGLGALNISVVVLCYGFLLVCLATAYNNDIQVRLTGGRDRFEGLLEVRKNSTSWGTVCDDSFDDKDATVVCRQLQMGRGKAKYGVRQGNGSILLDDVGCNGLETQLGQCSSSGWGNHNCDHAEDVSVYCLQDVQVRLTGGGHEYEGLLEVRLDDGYPWGTVCNDSFDEVDATIVCKMLRFRHGKVIPTAAGRRRSSMFLDDLSCSGNELNIAECRTKAWGSHDCSESKAVSLTCFQEIKVHLTGGYASYEGLLQVKVSGEDNWGSVCNRNFTNVDASVVCKQLNFERGQAYTGPVVDRYISLDDVDCRGSESVLAQCRSKPWNQVDCMSSQQVSVICQPVQAPKEMCVLVRQGEETRPVCYQFMQDVRTGDDDMQCSMFNADPVTIESPEEMANLRRILRANSPGQMWWIGLTRNSSLWKWSNGRTLAPDSPLWTEGEPQSECGYIADDKGGISTLPCSKRANYICETHPRSFIVDQAASSVADQAVSVDIESVADGVISSGAEKSADKENAATTEKTTVKENDDAIKRNVAVKENDVNSTVMIILSIAGVELLIIVGLLVALGFTVSLWRKAKTSARKGRGRTTDWTPTTSQPNLASSNICGRENPGHCQRSFQGTVQLPPPSFSALQSCSDQYRQPEEEYVDLDQFQTNNSQNACGFDMNYYDHCQNGQGGAYGNVELGDPKYTPLMLRK